MGRKPKYSKTAIHKAASILHYLKNNLSDHSEIDANAPSYMRGIKYKRKRDLRAWEDRSVYDMLRGFLNEPWIEYTFKEWDLFMKKTRVYYKSCAEVTDESLDFYLPYYKIVKEKIDLLNIKVVEGSFAFKDFFDSKEIAGKKKGTTYETDLSAPPWWGDYVEEDQGPDEEYEDLFGPESDSSDDEDSEGKY